MPEKLEYFYFDDKFFIEWTPDYEGSVSVSSKNHKGLIGMHDSTVPFFLYSIAKKIDDFKFLDKKIKEEILNSNEKFLGAEYTTLEDMMERNTEINKSRWTGFFEGQEIEEGYLKRGRKTSHISYVLDELNKINENPIEFEYIGYMTNSPSCEDKTPIHFLYSPDKKIYIAQYLHEEMNVIKLNKPEIINIIKYIIKKSNMPIAGALKSLIKKKNNF